MVLAIYIARHGEEEFSEPRTDILAARQFTIGRGNDCNIALQDNTRRVSRRHVAIERRGADYVLNVVSQINPVVVNGEVVAPGTQQPLRAGDRLIVGEYEFGFVSVEEDSAEPLSILPANPVRRPEAQVDLDVLFGATHSPVPAAAPKAPPSDLQDLLASRQAKAADPLLDVLGRSGAAPRSAGPADPLAEILGHGSGSASASTGSPDEFIHGGGGESPIDALLKSSGMPQSDPLGLSRDAPRPQGQYGGGIGGSVEVDHVPDWHLPLPGANPARQVAAPPAFSPGPPPAAPPAFTPGPTPAAPARPQPAPLPDPLLSVLGGAAANPPGVQPPAPPAAPDPLAALLGDAASRPPADDPLGLFGAHTEPSPARAAAAPAAETLRSPYLSPAQLRSAAPADASVPPIPPAMAPAAAAPAALPAGGAAGDAALATFLRGAGMENVDLSQADADAMLAECGATVRAAIEGLMGMLLARAKVKEELRAVDRTMVAAKENNALKLAESVDEALQFVFDPSPRSGAFLPPPKAVADACADLQTHELALVAGMRAALLGAIKRFEPEAIEKRLEKEGGGKSLLANRKAQLWDCFVAYYQHTQAEADDNFDRVFGAAFLRAYQEQVRRLSR